VTLHGIEFTYRDIETIFNPSSMVISSKKRKISFKVSTERLLLINAIKYPFDDCVNFRPIIVSSNFESLLFSSSAPLSHK